MGKGLWLPVDLHLSKASLLKLSIASLKGSSKAWTTPRFVSYGVQCYNPTSTIFPHIEVPFGEVRWSVFGFEPRERNAGQSEKFIIRRTDWHFLQKSRTSLYRCGGQGETPTCERGMSRCFYEKGIVSLVFILFYMCPSTVPGMAPSWVHYIHGRKETHFVYLSLKNATSLTYLPDKNKRLKQELKLFFLIFRVTFDKLKWYSSTKGPFTKYLE